MEKIKKSSHTALASALLAVVSLLAELFMIVALEVFHWGGKTAFYFWIFITLTALIASILGWGAFKKLRRNEISSNAMPLVLVGLILGLTMFLQFIGIAIVFCLMAFL